MLPRLGKFGEFDKRLLLDVLVLGLITSLGVALLAGVVLYPEWLQARVGAVRAFSSIFIALGAAAFAWVYRFRIRRQAREKLELGVSARSRRIGAMGGRQGHWELVISAEASAPEGGTAVEISPVGTALEAYRPILTEGRSKASWTRVDAWPVLESAGRLEPGERAADDVLVTLSAPGFENAESTGSAELKLVLVVQSAQGSWERARVVSLGSAGDNQA